MTIVFNIHYRTHWGDSLCVLSDDTLAGWTLSEPLQMHCSGEEHWSAATQVTDFLSVLHYHYAVRRSDGSFYHDGIVHSLTLSNASSRMCYILDFWHDKNADDTFLSKVFTESLFARKGLLREQPGGNVCFSLYMPDVPSHLEVGIMGDGPALGDWKPEYILRMSSNEFPVWTAQTQIVGDINYKYVLYDSQSGEIIDLEAGNNRHFYVPDTTQQYVLNDICFRRSHSRFRGAGTAIPVFSLRTEQSFGIGEFLDLLPLVDWAKRVGFEMIQTLPVNDTTWTYTNKDSYPYNAVSVFALHPIYINIAHMENVLTPAEQSAYRAEQVQLNALSFADYSKVYSHKLVYFHLLYERVGQQTLQSADCQAFIAANTRWLMPYARFCYLRDTKSAAHFTDWGADAVYKDVVVDKKCPHYVDIMFYVYLQYHASRQLSQVASYAHEHHVALKGDIPIGVSPDSVEVWQYPHFFHLNASAGAPPDDFSAIGQNWGFPTYNWEAMRKDNYAWWCQRLQTMQRYFDAYRIDHILGFFRIWQAPKDAIWGLTGQFYPALPYSLEELRSIGLTQEELLVPYITEERLQSVFGTDAPKIASVFFKKDTLGNYTFLPEFASQTALKTALKGDSDMLDKLLSLHTDVLFVRDMLNPSMYHPRIQLQKTARFRSLDETRQRLLVQLHDHFFYVRHNDFWKSSALSKLPQIISSNQMLVCGEDLGMVPACVPDVMNSLSILSLEIQRMPKGFETFIDPQHAPYLSVIATGTHDTSTLRGWWQENKTLTQEYFERQLHQKGEAPADLSAALAKQILRQHMESPAMWAILPLQDWLAIDDTIKNRNIASERINVPANPDNFWSYRLHVSLEQLLQADSLNQQIADLVSVR